MFREIAKSILGVLADIVRPRAALVAENTMATTTPVPIVGSGCRRRSGHAGLHQCGRRQRAMSVADRCSEGFITSTAWLPERERRNARRIPVDALGKNLPSPWHRRDHVVLASPGAGHAGFAETRGYLVRSRHIDGAGFLRDPAEFQASLGPDGALAAHRELNPIRVEYRA
jgi:hypothetical protein